MAEESWPQHYVFDPAPPPGGRTSRPRLIAAAAVLAIFAAGAAAAAVVATRGLGGGGSGGVESGIVDINTSLGDGSAAAGTGMLLNSSGEVLTNNHVVEGALTVNVQLTSNGSTYDAKVVGVDPTDDVAVVQLQGASGMPTVRIGDSSRVQVGDSITALGNALGRGGAPVSARGSVTALGQTITAADQSGANQETLTGMIQINAAIQPGDSGGPLVNSAGQVVGMDTAAGGGRHWRQLGAEVAFAIPINSAVAIAQQIASGAHSPNIQPAGGPLLGVDVQNSSSPLGALVVGVRPGTPAESAGLGTGDVITMLGGSPVDSVSALRDAISKHHAGDTVAIGWVDRSGQQHSANATLATAAPV